MVHLRLDGKPLEKRPMVTEIVPGGMGEQAGLKAGDILVQYNGRSISTIEEFGNLRPTESEDNSEKELMILRDGTNIVFKIKPGRLGVSMQDIIVPPAN